MIIKQRTNDEWLCHVLHPLYNLLKFQPRISFHSAVTLVKSNSFIYVASEKVVNVQQEQRAIVKFLLKFGNLRLIRSCNKYTEMSFCHLHKSLTGLKRIEKRLIATHILAD
ncbi:hypothetical protein AVEN_151887-1 [Araneus ventricosus]|uniref:Uncharacterized protein n=1 Tax=Araneus ventricosus TaxID=182803 RepID=A0A4Y2H249_ARAVE|nr:hypothetical protein AVEN_33743-1 [Araneus ventricosus]GBM60157.1 hypothetical protein AVEN_151887-1 [Araneus ventricosus]